MKRTSLEEILNVSHTTILNRLRDSVGMKLFDLCWIPNPLTGQLRASRIQKCQEFFPLLERMWANKFRNIFTGNKSWFMFEYQGAVKWSLSREAISERVRNLSVCFRERGILMRCANMVVV
jgi:hypothetical protein